MSNTERPPIGLTPRYLFIEKRLQDIEKAIARYSQARLAIPVEWIEEHNDIITELKKLNKL